MAIGAHTFDPRPAGTYAGMCTHCGGTAETCRGVKPPPLPEERPQLAVRVQLLRGKSIECEFDYPLYQVLDDGGVSGVVDGAGMLNDERVEVRSVYWRIEVDGILTEPEDTRTPEERLLESVEAMINGVPASGIAICLFCHTAYKDHEPGCKWHELIVAYEAWKKGKAIT